MSRLAPLIREAKDSANRSDLKFRLDRITSLHEHQLTNHATEDVLKSLFAIATEIQSNISVIVVRLWQGYESNRLGLADYWPKQLKPVFERPDIAVIEKERTLSDPDGDKEWYYEPDIRQKGDVPAISNFLEAVKEADIKLSIGSLLSFKIRAAQEELGRCRFYTSSQYPFADDEIEILRMIVKQVAVALYNAKQIQEAHRHTEGIKMLNNCIAHVIRQSEPGAISDSKLLITEITEGLLKVFDVSSVSFIQAYGDTQKQWRIVYTAPDQGGSDTEYDTNQGIVGWAIESGERKVLSDLDPDWNERYVSRVPGIRTSAAIPISINRETLGIVALESTTVDAFTKQDIELIETVVAEVPLALRNAALVSDLRQAKEELERYGWTHVMGLSVAEAVHRVGNTVGQVPTFVRNCKRLLQQRPPNVEAALSALLKIQEAGERMDTVIDKIQSATHSPKSFSEIHLSSALQEFVQEFEQKEVALELNVPPDLQVVINMDYFEEILRIVVENGIEASRLANSQANPYVTLRASHLQGKSLVIDIMDSGEGVLDYQRDYLCRTLVTPNFPGGNGIGLFLAGQRAHMLGGQLYLLSTSDTGAVFRLLLPFDSREAPGVSHTKSSL